MTSINCPERQSEQSNIPSTNYQSKRGVFAWKNGQVVRIEKTEFKDKNWESCEIEILFDVIDSGEYHIMVSTNEAIPQLYNEQKIDDIVKINQLQCYKYFVTNSSTDFQIFLTSYSGRLDIGVQPAINISGGQFPKKFEDFAIRRENQHEVLIDIRSGMRKYMFHEETGLFYVCVKGLMTSTYSLKVRESVQELESSEIEDGYAEQFGMRRQKIRAHLYKVPKLEYKNEDLSVQVNVVIKRGGNNGTQSPLIVYGRMCSESDKQECRNNSINEVQSQNIQQLYKGQDDGTSIQLIIDHDEQLCKELFNGNCYYVIVIQKQSDSFLLYEIVASHSQNNHIVLQENKPYIYQVDQFEYAYFKFQLPDASDIQNITFTIQPIHGDSDIYVSQDFKFPNKTNYTKRSVRVGNLQDHVQFSINDTKIKSLNGTYYIGVYGYTYSSFSLLVTIKRTQSSKQENLKASTVHLYENIPFQYSLHNELDFFYGYFEIDMEKGDERSIIIDIQNLKNTKTQTFISYNQIPSTTKYDFSTYQGIIKIEPQNKDKFHRQGIYYIMVVPTFWFLDLFIDNYYAFQLTWRLESSIQYLNAYQPLGVHIPSLNYTYIKHYIKEIDSNIRIQLVGGGQTDIVVSGNPNLHQPTLINNNFTTKSQPGENFANMKSLIIDYQTLQQINPSCTDLGYADSDPCILYIGIYCREQTECTSTIDIEYVNSRPKKIVFGQPKHSQISFNSTNEYSYYYIVLDNINQNVSTDIYAVLTPLVGDVDLVASIINNTDDINTWQMPTQQSNDHMSVQKLKTEMIHLSHQEIMNKCFSNGQQECIIVYGICAHSDNSDNNQTQDNTTIFSQAYFNFVVYKNVMELQADIPAIGYVKANSFSYFIYKSECAYCSIIVGLSSYSSGTPDLYIVKIDSNYSSRLPSQDNYDAKMTALNTEILTLDLNTFAFKEQNLLSMEGYYIFGVYGNKNSTFQLSVTNTQINGNKLINILTEGLSVKNTQQANTITYYQFYNWLEKDIEIAVSVPQGQVHMYVNPTKHYEGQLNLIEKLPLNKQKSVWSVENINPLSQVEEGKELLILKQDQNFCIDCKYLIGIKTEHVNSQYSIVIRSIDANQNYTHLLKIGESKMVKLQKVNEVKIFQFLLDTKDICIIVPTILSGQINIYVSFDESIENSILQSQSQMIAIQGDDLKTGINYYIIIVSEQDKSEFSLILHQHSTVIQIHDGIPQTLYYTDSNDLSKYMHFWLSPGEYNSENYTVVISVKSKTQRFYPVLYASVIRKRDINNKEKIKQNTQNITFDDNNLNFPPHNSQVPFIVYGKQQDEWNKDLNQLKYTLQIPQLPDDTVGLAINLMYHKDEESIQDFNQTQHQNKLTTSAYAIITMTHSNTLKLMPDHDYFGELNQQSSFNIFAVDPPENQVVFIQHAECLGSILVYIVDPTNPNGRISLKATESQGVSYSVVRDFKSYFLIMVQPLTIGTIQSFQKYEYFIKIQYLTEQQVLQQLTQKMYISKDQGNIKYKFVPKSRERTVEFSWQPLFEITPSLTKPVKNVRYSMVVSNDPNARLDSICAAKHYTNVFQEVGGVFDKTSHTISNLEIGKEIYFNIIAAQDDINIVIPYKPITIFIPQQDDKQRIRLYIMITVLLIAFMLILMYCHFKNKMLKIKLSEEVREIVSARSSDSINSVGIQRFGDVEKYNRLGGGQTSQSDDIE